MGIPEPPPSRSNREHPQASNGAARLGLRGPGREMLRYCKGRKLRLSSRGGGGGWSQSSLSCAPPPPRAAPRTAHPQPAGCCPIWSKIPNPVASGKTTNKKPLPAPTRAGPPAPARAAWGGAWWAGAGPPVPRAPHSQTSDDAFWLLGALPPVSWSPAWRGRALKRSRSDPFKAHTPRAWTLRFSGDGES